MNRIKNLTGSLLLMGLCSVTFVSCQQNDVSQIPEKPTDPVEKNPSEIFDFSTTTSATLSINYGIAGYPVKFAVYAEYPYNADGTENPLLQPIYAGLTDQNGKFNASFQLPSAADTVYLTTGYVGVPSCITLNKSKGAFSMDNSSTIRSSSMLRASTRSVSSNQYPIGDYKGNLGTYSWNGHDIAVSSLYDTYNNTVRYTDQNSYSNFMQNFWVPDNTNVSGLYQKGGNDELSLYKNVNRNLSNNDNTKYIREEPVTIHVNNQTASGRIVEPVNIDVVLLNMTKIHQNAIGYYYYPSDKQASEVTEDYIKSLPKYMVYPRITNAFTVNNRLVNTPYPMMRARLQFFGKNYDQAGTDKFPPGYNIGWVFVTDIYPASTNLKDNDNKYDLITAVNDKIIAKMPDAKYSNRNANSDNKPYFISVYDQQYKSLIFAIDNGDTNSANKIFKDALLYVESSDPDAIYDPDVPVIDPSAQEKITFTQSGTYAFEDIWPSGGDYDLNDVVVEYNTTVNAADNYVTSIVDKYKVVTRRGAATFHNAFGYVVNDNYGGSVSFDVAGFVKEADNQYIVFANANDEIEKSFMVTRNIPVNKVKASDYHRDYNPFIVVNYVKGAKNRIEVHLPKYAATSWASSNNGGENAYYVNKDGKYPFAIDLNGVVGFDQVSERATIGNTNEYPLFNKWVEEPTNPEYIDWYKYKHGK